MLDSLQDWKQECPQWCLHAGDLEDPDTVQSKSLADSAKQQSRIYYRCQTEGLVASWRVAGVIRCRAMKLEPDITGDGCSNNLPTKAG